jgi:hypothetical protein
VIGNLRDDVDRGEAFAIQLFIHPLGQTAQGMLTILFVTIINTKIFFNLLLYNKTKSSFYGKTAQNLR